MKRKLVLITMLYTFFFMSITIDAKAGFLDDMTILIMLNQDTKSQYDKTKKSNNEKTKNYVDDDGRQNIGNYEEWICQNCGSTIYSAVKPQYKLYDCPQHSDHNWVKRIP